MLYDISMIKENISVIDYLEYIGHDIIEDSYGFIYSPFRNENTPSFKISYTEKGWYDFGEFEGGNVIDLVMKVEDVNFYEALKKLNEIHKEKYGIDAIKENKNKIKEQIKNKENKVNKEVKNFKNNKNNITKKTEKKEEKPKLKIKEIKELSNKSNIKYLIERRIFVKKVKKYLKDIYYEVNGKEFFAIGFKNNSDGYELRNKYFKGSINKKDITTYFNNEKEDKILIFEGFMDFLSYITLFNDKKNFIILNSVSNIKKIIENEELLNKIKNYNIELFLDNDNAGNKAVEEIKKIFNKVKDKRIMYKGCKDLNEYLISNYNKKNSIKR